MDTTTATINTFFQLSIPIEHNGIINTFPTYHIFQLSKINLEGSHQAGIFQFSPLNQSRKCEKSVHIEMVHLGQDYTSTLST